LRCSTEYSANPSNAHILESASAPFPEGKYKQDCFPVSVCSHIYGSLSCCTALEIIRAWTLRILHTIGISCLQSACLPLDTTELHENVFQTILQIQMSLVIDGWTKLCIQRSHHSRTQVSYVFRVTVSCAGLQEVESAGFLQLEHYGQHHIDSQISRVISDFM
jgi:hypothetical protein